MGGNRCDIGWKGVDVTDRSILLKFCSGQQDLGN